ncbi:helix-turn-helix domain-containing protein [Paenibacillus contaminans]|uniref:helix-turn-helix domain-containing protein n=1 Tax=Paenibacillus contaminans TaxID=450362 RepID=UPI0011BF49B3|nr:helix-turn-helix domain-containing protein [Paenibacillus contaminans]
MNRLLSRKRSSTTVRRSILITLLVSYIAVLIIPVGIAVFLYGKIESILVENAERSNLALLEQVKQTMDSRLKEVEWLSRQIVFNPKLQWLLSNADPDDLQSQYRFIEFQNELSRYQKDSSFIYQFFIYFAGSGTVVSSAQKTDAATYFRDIVPFRDRTPEEMLKAVFPGRAIRAYLPSAPVQDSIFGKQLVTYVQSLPIDENRDVKGSLVILIDEQQIRDMHAQIELLNKGDIYILDENKQVVMSTGQNEKFLTGLEPQFHLESASNHYSYRGSDIMLSHTSSDLNGWTYISAFPLDVVMGKVNRIKALAFALLLVCLIAGTALSYWLAYKNYRPIRAVVGDIVRRKLPPGPIMRDEMELIRSTLTASFDEERQLKQTLERQAPVMMANFLTRLIKGHLDPHTISKPNLDFMGIRFEYRHFAVLLIDIDDCRELISSDLEKEWAFVRFIVANVSRDMLPGGVYPAELDKNRVAVLVNLPEMPHARPDSASDAAKAPDSPEASAAGPNGGEADRHALRQAAEELKLLLEQRFGMQITAAVSEPCQGMEEIGRCYREALVALDYKMVHGSGNVILYERIKHLKFKYYLYPMETEVQLMNLAKSGDWAGAEKLLDQLYAMNVEAGGMTPEMGKCLFIDMLSTIFKLLHTLKVEEGVIFRDGEDPVKTISSCATVEEMLEQTKRLYQTVCTHVKAGRPDRSEKLYGMITRYIGERYQESMLSLTTLADHFELSPQHLSAFFKKHSGQTITDYITALRMEHAKKMLADPTLTLSAVAQKVGYSTDVGFIRVFKKYEGITPGKYRETVES